VFPPHHSGHEEAYPISTGTASFRRAARLPLQRHSFHRPGRPDLDGVRWPLTKPLRSLRVEPHRVDVANRPVTVRLSQGYAVALAYPESACVTKLKLTKWPHGEAVGEAGGRAVYGALCPAG